jgi:O-antigen/teichoic acid export membrane protein
MTETNSPGTGSQPAAAPAPLSSGQSLARGVAWMGAAKWTSQLFTWVSTLVVARLLSPEDYGLVGLATMFMGLVTLLSEFGIGTTVVAMRDLTRAQLSELHVVAIMTGAFGFAVSCAAAPLLARFFDAPALSAVVMVMATTFIITGARVVPRAILVRDMRFRELAVNDALQSLTLAVGAVLFAWLGFRYWTLVVSAIAGAVISTWAVLRLVSVGMRWPRWEALRPATRFSQRTIVARLGWYAYSNADFFIAARRLGDDVFGAYRFAWDLANSPGEKIVSLVGGVTPSVLSAAQHDPAELRRIVLRVTEALALAVLPACIGLSLVAESLVPLVLTDKWRVMIAPLQLLGIGAAIRAVTPILPQVLSVTGHNRHVMWVNLAGAALMPLAFLYGSRYGAAGIAMGWIVAYPLVILVPMLWLALRVIQLPVRQYVRATQAAGIASLVMVAAVLALRTVLPGTLPLAARLSIDVTAGAAAYLGALLLFHRERLSTVARQLRRSLGR